MEMDADLTCYMLNKEAKKKETKKETKKIKEVFV